MIRRDWVIFAVMVMCAVLCLMLALRVHAQSYPNLWKGITDNQGHTVTVTSGKVNVVYVTPTPTPAPTP